MPSVHAGRSSLEQFWNTKPSALQKIKAIPLRVAALVFRLVIAVRNLFWRFGARDAGVCVISVGNLTVGGNAKTPMALYLAGRLRQQDLRVAIVSRGYGRPDSAGAMLAADRALTAEPAALGDEAAMMTRRFPGPIAVAKRRIDAINLLKQSSPIDVVILDDGFQHVRLRRDVDLVMVSRERGFGNGWMLPAGPMREPLSSLRRADAVIIVSSENDAATQISGLDAERIGCSRVLHASIRPCSLVVAEDGNWRELPLSLAGRRVLAVSGLANPAAFHAMLRAIGADLVGTFEYPDHHRYSEADCREIAAAAQTADLIVTTEKDLVKLERFPFPCDSLYALRLELTMPEADAHALDELIRSRLRRSPSAEPTTVEVSRDANQQGITRHSSLS